jgi:DC-STAMP-like protein
MGSTVLEEKYRETEDDTDGEKIEKKLLKRIEKECVSTIKRSAQNCKQIFADHFEQCEEKLSHWVSWIMCWPMRVDYVCDLTWLVVGKAPCDAKQNLEPGFGSAMNTLANSKHQLKSQLGKARFRYKMPDPDVRLKVQDVASSMQNITAEVHKRAQGAEELLGLMSKIVALLFLPTILESVKYVKNYLQRPNFDNFYVTSQFEHIDSKREQKGIKPVLLPFRALERRNLVLESDKLRNGPEKKGYLAPCIRLSLLFLVVLVVFSTDYIFYKTLKVNIIYAPKIYSRLYWSKFYKEK